jgi:hypothetical protein
MCFLVFRIPAGGQSPKTQRFWLDFWFDAIGKRSLNKLASMGCIISVPNCTTPAVFCASFASKLNVVAVISRLFSALRIDPVFCTVVLNLTHVK